MRRRCIPPEVLLLTSAHRPIRSNREAPRFSPLRGTRARRSTLRSAAIALSSYMLHRSAQNSSPGGIHIGHHHAGLPQYRKDTGNRHMPDAPSWISELRDWASSPRRIGHIGIYCPVDLLPLLHYLIGRDIAIDMLYEVKRRRSGGPASNLLRDLQATHVKWGHVVYSLFLLLTRPYRSHCVVKTTNLYRVKANWSGNITNAIDIG